MNLNDFINQYSGQYKGYPNDNSFKGQCVSLAKLWEQANGWNIIMGNAIDQPKGIDSTYQYIPNTPSGVPQAGDLMVWGSGVGEYGHVSIFVSGNTSSFTSFDQNWPLKSNCHIQSHNYNSVIGWIRHKEDQVTDQQAKMLIYKATWGHEPTGAELAFANGPITPDQLASLRFANDVVRGIWLASVGTDTCPPSEMIYYQNEANNNPNFTPLTLAGGWYNDHVVPVLNQAKLDAQTPLNAQIKALNASVGTLQDSNTELRAQLAKVPPAPITPDPVVAPVDTKIPVLKGNGIVTPIPTVEHSLGELFAIFLKKLFGKGII